MGQQDAEGQRASSVALRRPWMIQLLFSLTFSYSQGQCSFPSEYLVFSSASRSHFGFSVVNRCLRRRSIHTEIASLQIKGSFPPLCKHFFLCKYIIFFCWTCSLNASVELQKFLFFRPRILSRCKKQSLAPSLGFGAD